MLKKAVCFYISGHGFGHASRTMQVIKSLVEIAPDISIHIKTSTPRWFIESNFSPEHYTYHFQKNDIGVLQLDSLHLLPEKTLQSFAAFFSGKEDFITQEAEWIKNREIGLIVADIPPLAFPIAKKAKIPGVGIANFSWDWIYESFTDDFPQYRYLLDQIREAYSLCDRLYRLPFYGDLSAFPHICDSSLIVRTSTADRFKTRQVLGLPQEKKLILCSFGGLGINQPISFSGSSFALFYTTEKVKPTPGTWAISPERMKEASISYADLVAVADAILTKLGYGIVSEAVANKTPLLYANISAFREQSILQREVSDWIPALPVSKDSLFEGGWEETAQRLLEMDFPHPPKPLDGAEKIAGDLVRLLKK